MTTSEPDDLQRFITDQERKCPEFKAARDAIQSAWALVDSKAACDRCDRWPSVTVVSCYYGCQHAQCDSCAAQTAREAAEEYAYDLAVASEGLAP